MGFFDFISYLFFALLGGLITYLFLPSRKSLALEKKVLFAEMEKKMLLEQKQVLSDAKEDLKKEFELLSHRIYEQKTEKFREEAEKDLQTVIKPLKEKISEFQKQVEVSYNQEARERFALKKELEAMVASNQKISEEANNLTRAFKGDVKAQGCWGEVILEKVLESSGLRRGEEYQIQESLKDPEGKRLQPDIIIHLPEKKHLIIDAKLSLISYERYLSESTDEKKDVHIKSLIKSLYQHIDELHRKNYPFLEGINPPDFVLMFIPIEGLFSFSLQQEPEIFSSAWNKSIVLVSPSTLLATLRTISSIWKHERQNKNTSEIVKQSGLLYDKFANFVLELSRVQESLKKAEDHFDGAMRKLKTGKGNLLSRIENIKKLGAKTSKDLSYDEEIELSEELIQEFDP